MSDPDISPTGQEPLASTQPEVVFFVGRMASSEVYEIEPLSYETAYDGSIGLSVARLGELAARLDPDAMIWIRASSVVAALPGNEQELKAQEYISFLDGQVKIDLTGQALEVDGTNIPLTPMEFELLNLLGSKAGRVCSRGEIIRKCWGSELYRDPRTVDVRVNQIRRKLGEQSWILKTRWGLGYSMDDRFKPEDKSTATP